MKPDRQTQKKYCSMAMAAAIFVGLGFILLGEKAIGKGLILGSIFSSINFVLMGETLSARIVKEKRSAFFRSMGSIFLRYALLAIPVIWAVRSEKYNLFATTAGLFVVQLMILGESILKFLPVGRKEHI